LPLEQTMQGRVTNSQTQQEKTRIQMQTPCPS
jgi:hypothetical protein